MGFGRHKKKMKLCWEKSVKKIEHFSNPNMMNGSKEKWKLKLSD
jgi:hypothetical protein